MYGVSTSGAFSSSYSTVKPAKPRAERQPVLPQNQVQFGHIWSGKSFKTTFGDESFKALVAIVLAPAVKPIKDGAENLGLFISQKITGPIRNKFRSMTAKASEEVAVAANR